MNRLKEAIKGLRDRIENRFSSLVLIDGQMGQGKTTLAIQIAEEFQSGEVDFNYQYACGGEEFLNKYNRLINETEFKVIIYDEAGDFNKRGALTQFNNSLNRIFETFRTFNILVIIVLPFFAVLESSLFDKGVPRLLLNCYGRNKQRGKIRAYGLYKMLWLKHNVEYYRKNAIKQHCYKRVAPNFRTSFKDLPPSRSKMLDDISTKAKADSTDKTIEKFNLNIMSSLKGTDKSIDLKEIARPKEQNTAKD